MLEDVEDLVESFPAAEIAMVPVGRRREGVVVGTGGRWRLGRTRGRGCSVLHGALGHRHRGCAAPAAWALYAAYYTLGYHRTASHLVLKHKPNRAPLLLPLLFSSLSSISPCRRIVAASAAPSPFADRAQFPSIPCVSPNDRSKEGRKEGSKAEAGRFVSVRSPLRPRNEEETRRGSRKRAELCNDGR